MEREIPIVSSSWLSPESPDESSSLDIQLVFNSHVFFALRSTEKWGVYRAHLLEIHFSFAGAARGSRETTASDEAKA